MARPHTHLMPMSRPYSAPYPLLRWLVIVQLLGRAWQHWFWDVPIRALLWHESLMTRPVRFLLGWDWATYSSSLTVNTWITRLSLFTGTLYALAALAALRTSPHTPRRTDWVLPFASLMLTGLAALTWLEHFQTLGQWLEFGLQIAAPLLLFAHSRWLLPRRITIARAAVSLTFIGHGLYAFGIYPVPWHFVEMTMAGFHLSDSDSILLLRIVGLLDFVAALALWWPRATRAALWYCCIWGFMTALARVYTHFEAWAITESLHRWAFEMLYRLIHGGIPLWLLLVHPSQRQAHHSPKGA